MISETDIQNRNLAYYGELHDGRQWRPLVMTLVAEMYGSAGAVDACNFLRHVGTRIAAAHPLAEQPTLDELEARLNEVLLALDWGWVRLSVDSQSIRIVHGAYPGVHERAEHWAQAIAAVLEGMYQQWLQAQNEEVRLQVECIATSPSGALVFHCGG
ncbi:cellulose biosynthesis protein BcsD [Stutzerimonas azotifigens]|uniref:cellulose biosynthesis protein BcsD n=1 Tax=Stutzerimonas azotifigens TaxID=291995 RepID=UPI00040D98EB|nr:cellulose biosynthesis protein BcsD [Stutzerimonas azotifigens]